MREKFFCLDCEENFQSEGNAFECPFCGSENVMEDDIPNDGSLSCEWDNGHFEGDMSVPKPSGEDRD